MTIKSAIDVTDLPAGSRLVHVFVADDPKYSPLP